MRLGPPGGRRGLVVAFIGIALVVAATVLLVLRAGSSEPAPTHTAAPPPPPSSPPPPSAPHRAAVTDGGLVVDGKPFFPVFSWGECVDGFETSLPVGTNVYAGNRCGGLAAQVPALAGRALSAAVSGEAIPREDSVIGVFYPDEPDGQGMTGETLPRSDRRAGVRFLTLTNHFYTGAAPLAQGRGIYPGLIARADMVGFDLYPLQGWCRPDRLVDVYLAQRELVRLARGKPTFQWIEAAGMTCPHDGPTAVTPATVRAESWLAVAGGARGLGYFPPAAWTGDVGRAISGVTETVRELEPALLAPTAPVDASPADGSVRAGARAYHGELVVIVANAGYGAATPTITVPGLAGRGLRDVLSGQTVEPTADTFTASFGPLAARVYVTAGL